MYSFTEPNLFIHRTKYSLTETNIHSQKQMYLLTERNVNVQVFVCNDVYYIYVYLVVLCSVYFLHSVDDELSASLYYHLT